MSEPMQRLHTVVNQTALKTEVYGVSDQGIQNILRAVLAEMAAMAAEQEAGGPSIHDQQIGRYAGLFAKRLMEDA